MIGSGKMNTELTDSDSSEEYFDAEDSTTNRLGTLSRRSLTNTLRIPQELIFPEPAVKLHASSDSDATPVGGGSPANHSPNNSLNARPNYSTAVSGTVNNKISAFIEPKSLQSALYGGRQRFSELRQCMQTDDDDNAANTLTPDSQNSSVDGLFTNRPTHPFKVVENDAMSVQSMTSLGRVGRILAGNIDPTSISLDREIGVSATNNTFVIPSVPTAANAPRSPAKTSPSSSPPSPSAVVPYSPSPSTATYSVLNDSERGQSYSQQVMGGNLTSNRRIDHYADTEMNKQTLSNSVAESSTGNCESVGGTSKSIPTVALTSKLVLQEPDVIASTKLAHSKTTDSITSSGPVAPPRRKKRNKKLSSLSSEPDTSHQNEAALRMPIVDTDTDNDACSIQSIRDTQQQRIREDLERLWIEKRSSLPHSSNGTTGSINGLSKLTTIGTGTMQSINNINPGNNVGFLENHMNMNRVTLPLSTSSTAGLPMSATGGAINRISHSLGNSATSVRSTANTSPKIGRASSINHAQGLNVYKARQGSYVVKPCDEASNRAEGPTIEEMQRVERLLNENIQRPKLAGTGSNSLGSATRYAPSIVQRPLSDKERRKSAGDEDILKQLNLYVRTRTSSGKQLSDFEILEQVPVKNLDTGENIPLSKVRPPPVPEGWNPLSLHILKLTSHLEVGAKESDDESVIGIPPSSEGQPQDEEDCEIEDGSRLKKRTAKIKRFFGSTVRKTVDKAKSFASEVSHARHKEDVADIVDVMNPEQNIKIKASSTNKGPYEFTKLQHVQDLSGEHTGAVWCMKFSSCGRLLATAGQDKVLRIWVLKDAYQFFQDVRNKYADQKSSPTPSQESLVTQHSIDDINDVSSIPSISANNVASASCPMVGTINNNTMPEECSLGPFMPKSFCTYVGHTSDLLDVSWSKNYFILSSSMDKTVRLWHISRKECLCCFQHIDFVTAIAFHPRDDRYFLSGSLDGKLRLWNIPDKKVALWNEVDGQTKLITAANFCQNGQFAVVGSYDGRCIFYNTDQLKYHTQIHVRSSRGKNRIGRKISGIEPMPGEDKILVTSNDSRVRLYDLRDLNVSCKYKGYLNVSSQIKASFSHDGKYIIAGSENQCIYIWKTNHDYMKLSSVRRDRSDFWEGIKAHNATVTCAIFAPHPENIIKPEPDEISNSKNLNNQPDPLVEQHKKGCGYVMISADFNGAIKVFINKTKPKHSSLPYTAIAD